MKAENTVIIRTPQGLQDYAVCWKAMQDFTNARSEETLDEIWLLEHFPVFTQGQNGKPEHILDAGHIPVVQSDRGGQITYHGPGQLVAYTLVDLKRKKFNIRQLVSALEQSIINLMAIQHVEAESKCDAPGVYVNNKKLCSVGLRVRKGCSYHGLALNVNMDLSPFLRINPCGFNSLEMTQVSDLTSIKDVNSAKTQLIEYLMQNLGYTNSLFNLDPFYGIENTSK